MKDSNVVIFSKNKTLDLLEQFDFKVSKRKVGANRTRDIVIHHNGDSVECGTCKKEITPKRVGTIAKGSRLIFCDNPMCFATWVALNKIN